MKKWAILAAGAALLLAVVPALAGKPDNPPGQTCTTIPSGELDDSVGNPLTTGYNEYGYNYQARIFLQGIEEYCRQRDDIPEGEPGHWDYDDCVAYFEDEPFPFYLMMKWNDAWLSNKDCDDDGKLDRHDGFDSYIGSGAWLTNHQWGDYEMDGKMCKWNYFVKIVAAPADAESESGVWYTADDVEIGPVIWGSFAIIEEVYNDPCDGYHGLYYKGEAPTGFGFYLP